MSTRHRAGRKDGAPVAPKRLHHGRGGGHHRTVRSEEALERERLALRSPKFPPAPPRPCKST
eukprot:8255611-Pyramimonas_sp.AAC.1